MNDCGRIRELLPELVRGELSVRAAIIAKTHADSCAECRDELRLVRMLSDNLAPLPAGLEDRVIMAVRNVRPMPSRRWSPAHLAMAATVAAAVIGGSIMYRVVGFNTPAVDLTNETATLNDQSAVGWAATEDPMLHGASFIQERTVEELEMILAEIDG